MQKQYNALENQVAGKHYKDMPIQVVEFCHANNIPYMEGSAIKYLCRWRKKGGLEDLKKARHYIELLMQMENENTISSSTEDFIRGTGQVGPMVTDEGGQNPYCDKTRGDALFKWTNRGTKKSNIPMGRRDKGVVRE